VPASLALNIVSPISSIIDRSPTRHSSLHDLPCSDMWTSVLLMTSSTEKLARADAWRAVVSLPFPDIKHGRAEPGAGNWTSR
jgi:hypothetical protein